MISTSTGPICCLPILDRSASGRSAAILYDLRVLDVSKIVFVTDSGAGAPLARLYLIPKSSVGPMTCCQLVLVEGLSSTRRTTRVVTGGEQDAACGFVLADDVARRGCAHDTVLTKYELLDAIGSSNLDDELHDLGVPEAAVTADDEEAAIDALWYGE